MRLDPRFRRTLYAAFAVLFATGSLWLVADALKDPDGGDAWQQSKASLLMLHGGAAMATLMFLGALVPLHILRAWRAGRNRATGSAMVAINALFIVTAFGLYYLGSETLRSWMSNLHIGLGFGTPFLLFTHIWWGRRRSESKQRDFRPDPASETCTVVNESLSSNRHTAC